MTHHPIGSTSVASFSFVASTGSASSVQHTIIPLYNIQAHNVLTNTIGDAGTDAEIMKLNEQGMELIGLAFLEPIEVWSASAGSPQPSRDGLLSPNATDASPFLCTTLLSIPSWPTAPDILHTPASSASVHPSRESSSAAHAATNSAQKHSLQMKASTQVPSSTTAKATLTPGSVLPVSQ
jgi:hypothetical protein